MTSRSLPRRTVLGTVGAGAGAAALSACGGTDTTASDSVTPSAAPTSAAPSPTPTPEETEAADPAPEESSAAAATGLVATGDVPVGGGVILDDVVVTQPSQGDFRAFSPTCTHQGCKVAAITETIDCPCHGGKFALDSGDVVSGPPAAPLAEVAITVNGNQIERA